MNAIVTCVPSDVALGVSVNAPDIPGVISGSLKNEGKAMQFYVSALTQKVHTDKHCSVTRRNHALNLETPWDAQKLAEHGYIGCKRCGAYEALTTAQGPMVDLWRSPSGRLHLRQTCSGGAPAQRMTPVRIPESELEAMWAECLANRTDPTEKVCRCMWGKIQSRKG